MTVGYAGSLRKDLPAFQALVNIARARPEVRVFVMSNALPQELKALPPEQLEYHPYQFNYAGYARVACEAQPDVLIAPLGRSRFEASKAPNKYLEITAIGAAGVYTHSEPYLSYVEDGRNGLLAGDDVEDWQAKIERLIDDADLRARLVANAADDIRANFDTRAMLPTFLTTLLDAVDAYR